MSDDLQKRAAGIINSSWHFSWHWDKTENGRLTLQGWRDAVDDGLRLRDSLRQEATQIDLMVREITDHILSLQERGIA